MGVRDVGAKPTTDPGLQVSERAIVQCLMAGGVVLLPTDTVYGLAAHPSHPEAISRLFDLKGRPTERRLPVLTSKRDIALLGGKLTLAALKLLQSPWVPGPVSIAVELDQSIAPAWLAGRDEVAFRAPKDAILQRILLETGPLFVTSANRHGDTTPETLAAAKASLIGAPDLSIDGGMLSAIPSTLVNCRVSPPRIERIGQVRQSDLEPYLS
jgi:L-threonylcarbamoyladenylate synthase